MNRLACLVLGTILFHVGAVSTRAQQGSPEQELIRLEKQWAAALGDTDFLNRITAHDYVIVDASGDVRNKRQELALSQNEKFTTSTIDDLSVRVYGDSAVVLGRYSLTGTSTGQPYTETGRFTDVWVKRSGLWVLVSSQNTNLPADASPHGQQSRAEEGAPKEPETQSSDAASTARDEKELIQLENDLATATLKGDRDFYDRVQADDWINIHEDGSVGTKQGDAAHKSEYDTATVDDIKVRVYGHSAVAVGRYSVGWTEGGRRSAASGRFTDVWVRRKGRWQIVSSQNTAFPEANAKEFPPDSFFIAKEKEDWEALKNKDKAAAARLLADDFVGMYDFGFFNKSEWVKQMDDQYTVDDYTIENAKVLHPSPTTALLLYTSTCKGTGEWAEYCSHTQRISDLWVQRNGQWLDLFSQDTQATSGESDDATVLKEIIASENQIVGALSRDDIAGFGKLLPEDVLDIWTDGVHNKAEWIPQFEQQKKEGYLFRDFRFDDPKLIRLAPDAAILIATEIIHGLDKGKPFEQRLYTMACYVHRNGKWVPRVYQDTPVESDESDEAVMKAIVANEKKIMETLQRNDIAAFGEILPDDVIMVEDEGIHTKTEWLKEFEEQKKSGLLFTDFKMDDLRLVRYGPFAGTLVFRETINGTQSGKPFEWHFNSSSGYVNRSGKWMPILYQDSVAK